MSKKRSASISESNSKSKPIKTKKIKPIETSAVKLEKKPSTDNHKTKTLPKKSHSTIPPTNTNSETNQIDFPRGGGIALTSYQQAEAKRDGTQQAEQLVKSINSSQTKLHSTKRSLSEVKTNSKKIKPNGSNDHIVEAHRIEHLNSKRLIPGIKLAGVIIQVTPLALIVALPSHLIAHVPISEISSFYTQRLVETTEEDEIKSQNSSDHSTRSENLLKSLNQMFYAGQWIRCSVLQETPNDSHKSFRVSPIIRAAMKVTLTLDPAHVNSDINRSNLHSGMTLTGAVKSVEDKGYIIDFGIPIDPNISSVTSQRNYTAFVSFSEANKPTGLNASDSASSRWEIGQIVWCRFNSLSDNGITCMVSVNPQDVSRSLLTTALSIDSILPLHRVSCHISAIIPSRGLNVDFLGFFKGSIDFSHLGLDGKDELALDAKFKVGQKLAARVLWDTIPSKNHVSVEDHESILGPKIFSLTLLDHVVKQDSPGLPSELYNGEPATHCDKIDQIVQYPVGYIFQTVKIFRVDEEWGLYATCINKVDGHPIEETSNGKLPIGFAHISAITDSFLPSLSAFSGPYKIGSTHKARVTGISPVDGCLQLTLQPSVIEQTFMRMEDIPAGALIDVTVKRLTTSLLVVKINETIDGIVWPDHFSDIKLRQPEKKFLPGAKLKARVLYSDPEKNRVLLTLRKTLLNLDSEIITSYESARVGLITYGFVTDVQENSAMVSFFGRTKGTVKISQAEKKIVESMTELFSPGKSIKVKVTAVNVERRRISVTPNLTATEGLEKKPTVIETGDQVSAFVIDVVANHVKLNLYQLGTEPSTSNPVRGLISLTLLASKRGTSVDDLKSQLKKGDEIKGLTVTGEDKIKHILIVAFKSSPAHKSQSTSNPANPSNQVPLTVGDEVTGTIRFQHQKNLVLLLQRDNQKSATEAPVEGFLPISLLAQKQKVSLKVLQEQTFTGQRISGLRVTHNNVERGLLFVGFPNLQSNEPTPALDLERSEPQLLFTSDRVIGRICFISRTNIQMDLRKEGTEGYADKKGIISIEKVAKHRHLSEEDLRSKIQIGDYISELMVRKKTEQTGLYLLKFSPSEGNPGPASGTLETQPGKTLALSIGDSVIGSLQAIHEKNIVFSLKKDECEGGKDGATAVGIMRSRVLAGHWHTDVNKLKDKLQEGQIFHKLIVNKIQPDRSLVIVGFAPAPTHIAPSLDKIDLEMVLKASIIGKNAQGVQVTPVDICAPDWKFLIDYTDISDDYDEKDKISHVKGSILSAVVVRIDKSSTTVYLSTRPSDLNKSSAKSSTNLIKDPPIRSTIFSQDYLIRGFVQTMSSKVGLILQIGTGFRGTVPSSKLPPDWKTKFQVGQVVSAKIRSFDIRNIARLCLLERSNGPQLNMKDLKVGQTFMVRVCKMENYGMFLEVPATKIRCLCHCSQVYDDQENPSNKWKEDAENQKFKLGMQLKAAIIMDKQANKFAFTIKPSVVGAQPEAQSTNPQNLVADQQSSPDQSKQDDSDESTDDEPSGPEELSCKEQPKHEVNQPATVSIDFTEPSLPLSTGFWKDNQSKQPDDAASSDEESTNDHYFSSKRISNPIEDKSIDELEKSLLESPNSSQQWIRLINTYVQKAELTKARETAKRALEAIHYREENEKWKVWICLLNLENTYGTEEQFSTTFKEASVRNDSKTVWLKVAEIYSQSGKIEKADETYSQAIKKFRESCKVWCLYGAFCLQNNLENQYANLLARSLKSLPKRKHIKTITKFAQLEFKLGDAERGRTLFEGLVGSYPKRTDIWKVYLDLEIKAGTSAERIRGLFSRMMGLKLNPAKTKAALKRWYNFEKTHGDKESQEMVIEKAQSYVSSLIKPSSNAPTEADHECYQVDDDDDGPDE